MTTKCLITVLVITAISCNESNIKIIEVTPNTNLKEERLGQSTYHVKFPSNMFIEEARGKEGQFAYGLWQIDSAKRYERSSGFIEIEHGDPIGGEQDVDKVIDKVRSNLLGKSVIWKIGRTETGYFDAVAYHGKLTLSASSPTRAGLDSMIAIVSTLTYQ